jgi:hypothetical protein
MRKSLYCDSRLARSTTEVWKMTSTTSDVLPAVQRKSHSPASGPGGVESREKERTLVNGDADVAHHGRDPEVVEVCQVRICVRWFGDETV